MIRPGSADDFPDTVEGQVDSLGLFDGGTRYFVFVTLEIVRRVAQSQVHVDSTVINAATEYKELQCT